MKRPPLTLVLSAPVLALGFAPAWAQETGDEARRESARRRTFEHETIEGQPMYTVLAKDGIPAIDHPRFVDVVQALEFMQDDEPVLGVVGQDGTAKAYSAWLLDAHEIVNDDLDGEPIAATW